MIILRAYIICEDSEFDDFKIVFELSADVVECPYCDLRRIVESSTTKCSEDEYIYLMLRSDRQNSSPSVFEYPR